LSKEEYGIIDVFFNLSFILGPFVGLNIGSAVLRYYFEKKKIAFDVFLYNVILFLVGFGLIFTAISIPIIFYFGINFEINKLPIYLIPIAILYALFSQLIEVVLSFWRAQEKPINFGVFRILKTIVEFGVSIYFIIQLKYGWEGRIYPSLIITSIFGLLAVILLYKTKNIKPVFNKRYTKIAVKYSFPLILHNIGGYLISFSDRFIILFFLGVSEVGVYAVAYQIGMVMSFINNSFNQAWTPYFFSILKSENKNDIIRIQKINNIYFILMLLLIFVIYLIVPFIYKSFIGKNFIVKPSVVLWVLLGYGIHGMYKMVVNYMFYYKNTKKLGVITFLSSILNLISTFILVPELGILGASISTTIGFLSMFIFVYIEYRRKYYLSKNLI
jgi:O-antigen/teichoic acid export membrane protein